MMTDVQHTPIPTPVKSHRWNAWWILGLVLVLVAVGFGAFGGVSLSQDRSDITQLRQQLAQDRGQINRTDVVISHDESTIAQDKSDIESVQSQANSLSSQIAGLSTPTDPLSAYNQICNGPLTNAAGVTQTYYYPCTDSVQTIPQPGG